jgi:hypothetical protein
MAAEAPSTKHQIPNNDEIPNPNPKPVSDLGLVLRACLEFGAW